MLQTTDKHSKIGSDYAPDALSCHLTWHDLNCWPRFHLCWKQTA